MELQTLTYLKTYHRKYLGNLMKKKKIVYVPMGADIIHSGHLNILNHARKYQISPYKLLTDAQMTMLSHKKPNSKKDLDSYGFENNNFINENVEQIIAIFKK